MMHWEYLKYVLRHKWYVLLAGLKLGVPLRQLVVHDWSKFLPSEWLPYARHFYGGAYSAGEHDARKAAFREAWLKHLHRSPHHHQYWLLREDSGVAFALEMPERFAREMVADWAGAGRAQLGDSWTPSEVVGWYEKNEEKMVLHTNTRSRVEEILAEHFGEVFA